MSKSLRDFIAKNKADFDDREPSEKIWKEIDAALPKMKSKSLWQSVVAWRAAAILFMSLSVYFFITRPSEGAMSKPESSITMEKDLNSLESFYGSEIASKIALISTYENANDLDQFTQDFQKLDAMYLVLKEEMKAKPSQKVKDALILNMLIRIDLLNQQLHRLDKVDKDSVYKKNSNV